MNNIKITKSTTPDEVLAMLADHDAKVRAEALREAAVETIKEQGCER